MRLKALAGASLLCWAATTLAQESRPAAPADAAPAEAPKPTPPPQTWKFELHGFVSASMYLQDGSPGPGNGQIALYANTVAQPRVDRLVLGGDIRQSRWNFSVSGPKAFGGATPKGVMEIDWFGGWGSGVNGDVSLAPRVRLMYAELNWGNHRIQAGQQFDLSFAMAPNSLSHIAFPLGFGTGNMGWRRPGLFAYHTFGDVTNKDAMKWEFAWEVGRSQWADNGTGAGTAVAATATTPAIATNGIGAQACTANPTPAASGGDRFGNCQGEASGLPAVQARLTASAGQVFSAFVYGHWSRIDRNGAGLADTSVAGNIYNNLDTIVGGAGFKVAGGPLTLAATGYYGKNTLPLTGAILQQLTPITAGDVREIGGWAQLGLNLTKELSVWGFIGAQRPDYNDALAAGYARLLNVTSAGMLQYRDAGYAVGLEWLHFHTRGTAESQDVNQWIASANYFF